MFSSAAKLKERTPQNGVGREDFLAQLVDEFIHTKSQDAKEQVLANLANFAYDPLNYEWMRNVGVLDVFLHTLRSERGETLTHFACAGICNACLDPLNAEYIIEHGVIDLLITKLDSKHPQTLADTITSLIFLSNDQTRPCIATQPVIQTVQRLQKTEDRRISNVATIFLNDVAGMALPED